jgi:predicted nucleic acid-binding protein
LILYLDTSALVKRYLREFGSSEVIAKCQEANRIAASCVAFAETMATLHRKRREGSLDDRTMEAVTRTFRSDWDGFVRVDITATLNVLIEELFSRHPLRGFDAIHLASALMLSRRLPEEVVFACYDEPVLRAGRSEGLTTLPSVLS